MNKRKPKPNSEFSKRLSQLLDERSLTIREAAAIAKVPMATLGNWRSGVQPTDFHAVRRLAQHLGTSLSYLLTGESDNDQTAPQITQVFEDGPILIDGFCKIILQKLIPKNEVVLQKKKHE